MISDLEIKADDFTLSDYFDLTKEPDRQLFPTVETESVKLEGHNGERFSSATFGQREISLEIYLYNKDVRSLKDKLAEILMLKEFRLWFSDEPDRYFIARLDGESTIERAEDHSSIYTGELKFIVLDGVAHATEVKTFEITEDEDGERVFHITNNGTAPARVTFDLQATQDVDSFALITGNDEDEGTGQVLQIGDEDDPEITEQEPQTYLWKGRMKSNQKSNWKENIATPNYLRNGDSDTQSRIDGNVEWRDPQSVGPSTYGDYADDMRYWHGPSITRHINQLVDNFILHTRFHMRVTPESLKGKKRLEAQGIIEFNVYDNDDQLVIGANFKDKWAKEKTIQITVYLANIVVYKGDVPWKLISKTKRFAGWITFQKIGNKFTVRISKSHNGKQQWSLNFDRTNEAAGRLQASRVDYWFGRKGARRPYKLDIARSNFKILNTEDEADIPNHINEDDEILIDGQESKVYINEALSPEYFILGSQFIEVPPGETDIYVVDDGALTGTASIEEVYV